jgi:hypothetical protein
VEHLEVGVGCGAVEHAVEKITVGIEIAVRAGEFEEEVVVEEFGRAL